MTRDLQLDSFMSYILEGKYKWKLGDKILPYLWRFLNSGIPL